MESNTVTCKYHPGAKLEEDFYCGDIVCTVCGLVVVDRCINYENEWRNFGDEREDNCRVGQEENGRELFDGITSTTVQNSSYNPKFIDENGENKFSCLKNTEKRTPTENYLIKCLHLVKSYNEKMNGNENIEKFAVNLIKDNIEQRSKAEGNKRMRKHKELVAVALLLSFKHYKLPRSIEEVENATNNEVERKDMIKIIKMFKIKNNSKDKQSFYDIVKQTISKNVSAMGSNRKINMKIEKSAIKFGKRICELFKEKDFACLVVSAISAYIAAVTLGYEHITKEFIANKFNIPITNFSKHYTDIMQQKECIITEEDGEEIFSKINLFHD